MYAVYIYGLTLEVRCLFPRLNLVHTADLRLVHHNKIAAGLAPAGVHPCGAHPQ
jgi:hypothetical protein